MEWFLISPLHRGEVHYVASKSGKTSCAKYAKPEIQSTVLINPGVDAFGGLYNSTLSLWWWYGAVML